MSKTSKNSAKEKQGFSFKQASSEVAAMLATMDKDVLGSARLANSAYSRDARINKYLTSKDEQGLAFFVDKDRRNQILKTIEEGYGMSSTAAREAAIRHAFTQDVAASVDSEIAKVIGDAVLTEEQTKAMLAKAESRKNFIVNKLLPGMLEVARTNLGIVEDAKATAKAEASEELAAVES